jgi:hypothetical protein
MLFLAKRLFLAYQIYTLVKRFMKARNKSHSAV